MIKDELPVALSLPLIFSLIKVLVSDLWLR